jgi:ATP-dependent helicase HrpB
VAAVVREALNETESDVLVFLPGAGEIHRVAGLLQSDCQTVRLFALHGTLPVDQQDAAIAPSPPGSRKVVLATSIAETSLTIEGVRVVVDAGLMRVPRFSPRTGMSRLETIRVSRASADQRRGRAGRVAPGICYRLWDAHEEHGLVPFNTPEILATDLAPLALDLAAAGVRDPRSLKWLDPPPEAPFAQARALLVELGALSRESRVASREMGGGTTEHGRRMAELPIHPRLAHMLLQGARLGEAAMAAELAALLGDRDILRRADGPTGGRAELPVDIGLRLDALRGTRVPDAAMDRAGAARARQEASVWIRTLRPVSPSLSDASRPTHSRTASPAAATPPAGFSSSTAAARAFPSTIRSRWRNGSWHSSWMMWAPTAECGSRRRSTRTMWQQSRRNARRLMRKSGGTQRPRVSSPGVSPAWVRSHSRSGRSPIPTRRSCGSHCSRESGRAASRRCRGASQAWRCGRGWPFSISPIQRGPM